MNRPGSDGNVIRFGAFDLDVRAAQLRKYGVRIRLQEQPLRILLLLLDRPGEIVSREELREQLWPSGTYVDFDHSLNAAIAKLRVALGDSSGAPRYVETVPRRGYRFIGSATRLDTRGSEPELSPTGVDARTPVPPASPGPISPRLSARPPLIRAGALVAGALAIAILIGTAASLLVRNRDSAAPETAIPLTTLRGAETTPAFSPDGSAVAFLWENGETDKWHIWIKRLGSETPRPFTSSSTESEFSPAWSRDGKSIAFLRALPGNRVQYVVKPYPDGLERVVATTETCLTAGDYLRSITWHPDGKHLIVSASTTGSDCGLAALSTATGALTKLTQSPPGQRDLGAAVSPDGRTLVFVRGAMYPNLALYAAALAGNSMTTTQAWKVTAETDFVELGPTWLPASNEIVYARGNASSGFALYRIAASGGGKPRPIHGAGPGSTWPSVRSDGALVFVTGTPRRASVWRVHVCGGSGREDPSLAEVAPSSYNQQSPALSPDETRVAFESERSGKREIWTSDLTGTAIQQITNDGANSQGPDWAPDGSRLVFSKTIGGQRDIYVVDAAGGVPRRLTHEAADDAAPSWSRDGRSIYFHSNRTGVYEVWRMAADGTNVNQLTRNGGWDPRQAVDGTVVYYRKSGGLWRIGLDLGPETQVLDSVSGLNNAAPVQNGILFIPAALKSGAADTILRLFDSTTGRTKDRAVIPGAVGWGLSASRDGCRAVITRVKTGESDLLLIKTLRP